MFMRLGWIVAAVLFFLLTREVLNEWFLFTVLVLIGVADFVRECRKPIMGKDFGNNQNPAIPVTKSFRNRRA